MLTLRNLQKEDVPLLMTYDKKVPLSEWDTLLHSGRVLVAEHNGRFSGWLRYDFFASRFPMVHWLGTVLPENREEICERLLSEWETRARIYGSTRVMADVLAQEWMHDWFCARGYRDCGTLLLPENETHWFLTKSVGRA